MNYETISKVVAACSNFNVVIEAIYRLLGRQSGILRLKIADYRGVAAIFFGISATAVIGMVGLGTEGGVWYLTRRNAQNAADPAAYAGAVRLAFAQAALSQTYAAARTQAINTATDTSTSNRFTLPETTVFIPPSTGPNAGNPTAVEVIVQRTAPRLISRMFLTADPVVRARGVAALTSNGPACLLANPSAGGGVTGQLLFSGSTNVQSPNCVLASNSALSNAVDFNGNAAVVNAESISAAGGCNGCSGSGVTLAQPITTGTPTTDPFGARAASLLTLLNAVPSFTTCQPIPGVANNGSINVNPLTVNPPPAGVAYCSLNVSNGQTVNFSSGTYYFSSKNINQPAINITGGTVNFGAGTYYLYGSSLSINGGTVNGTGVSFVFTGPTNQVGGPDINGNATVNLTAPRVGQATNAALDGLLFYRDPRATNGNSQGNPVVNINGGPSVTLTGAMYFPNSYVKYSGSSTASICSVLIGGTVAMSGNSGLNVSNCGQFGNITPTTTIVRLME